MKKQIGENTTKCFFIVLIGCGNYDINDYQKNHDQLMTAKKLRLSFRVPKT